MKLLINKMFYVSLLLLGLSACSNQQSLPPHAALQAAVPHTDAACNVTQASFNHIEDGHCPAGAHQHGDQFLATECTLVAQQTLCADIQNNPDNRTLQGNKVCYDKTLAYPIGAAGQTRGRLVITSTTNGDVITQFPVAAGSTCP